MQTNEHAWVLIKLHLQKLVAVNNSGQCLFSHLYDSIACDKRGSQNEMPAMAFTNNYLGKD